ncbi:T9SS type A sorting domain-containing protein [Dyadobacter psychrophilus]|uniref:Por secretion system C-terminal sorting domain-containing protein n=1 Tax=Dyadobacter psychrophilus TaxID=651661 RepID=A0A1T5E446_9BACT|nr:T9SS type A sorting domain-containing protein [Dyadobacter psychrophilus]SKB78533.1 Por secretion system C-terminal sorting domain-containing protein [Dyadobacter psychrophilus]
MKRYALTLLFSLLCLSPYNLVFGNSPSTAGAETFTVCVEAENSTGDGPITEDPNASNGKTRGAQDNWNHYVEYEVNDVKVTGSHTLKLRYYAAGNGVVNIMVNGAFGIRVGLPATHSWNIVWAEHTMNVNLNKGNNKIRIMGEPFYSPVRQDRICVTGSAGNEGPVSCDFNVTVSTSTATPACSEEFTLDAGCSGPGCDGLVYSLVGSDISVTGQSAKVNAPPANGTYYYSVAANKEGCPGKVANTMVTVTSCTPDPEPFTACIEAENSNGTGPITDDPNASNGKTRGAPDNWNHYVDYMVTGVKATGWHLLTIRYYAAGNGIVNVIVNGEFGIRTGLPATNSWNIVWAEHTLRIKLNKGDNRIRIVGEPSYSPVRQDRICIRGDGGPDNPLCDFTIEATTLNDRPVCSGAFTLRAECVGYDCNAVTYQWSGNGVDKPGRFIDVNAPASNGTFAYTVTAVKDACAPKTSTVNIRVSNCGGVQEPFSTCIESEDVSGSGPVSSDPNASNGGTRGAENNYNYYLDYPVTGVQTAGTYQLKLRYYAARIANVSVSVNGNIAIASAQLPATHSWNIVWREETLNIPLSVGNNVIRIQGLPGASCRQDRICITGGGQNARMAAPEAGEEGENILSLQAYPNPTRSEFKAVFQLEPGKIGTLSVVDMKGRSWHERQVKGKGTHQERINLEGAPSGIYLLQVKKGDSLETKKILIAQ